MHEEPDKLVLVVEEWLSKVDIDIVDYWVEVTILIKDEIGVEIDIKIFELEGNIALVWENPWINWLMSLDVPAFNGREVQFQ